ncbi:alpha/beta-hydrolase [Trichodelitschia bisporula]|uniref:Alpha/beta-hydrolase n=1 Tax=Trichodelitschia bisporula TaxID=703511 RepID=A0A6G1I477_9PEZI|nr:alpha/beta-hydrolase [Trichodelitschia bisporula]
MSLTHLLDVIPSTTALTRSNCLTAGAAAIGLALLLGRLRNRSELQQPADNVIPSPLTTALPSLSPEEIRQLAYPPDLFPGARDVDSLFGTFRVYEWGPEEGRKVLLVHGISTPCVSLGGVAHELVKRGYRVMLLDLYGRGWSATPSDTPHDARLYNTQILHALASSPLPWTQPNGFALVGYSLGGGIAASFTSTFPALISSLVLIAPSGLIRPAHFTASSKLLYALAPLVPKNLLFTLVRKRLMGSGPPPNPAANTSPETKVPEEALAQEAPQTPNLSLANVADAVLWQLHHHDGFMAAFASSIRHAPITGQDKAWARIGARLTAQHAAPSDEEAARVGLLHGKALLLFGAEDTVIVQREVEPDATELLGGSENVEVKSFQVGHELPVLLPAEVAKAIWEFWGE